MRLSLPASWTRWWTDMAAIKPWICFLRAKPKGCAKCELAKLFLCVPAKRN